MNKNQALKFLEKKPHIKGVTGFLKWSLLETGLGIRDSKQNQICDCEDGHTTPWVNSKARCYDSYVDRVYVRTTSAMENLIKEASASVTELLLIRMDEIPVISGNSEEENRQKRRVEKENALKERRREELLTNLSGYKTQVQLVDEKVVQHIEAAENTLHAHVLSYWRGVLMTAGRELENYPKIITRAHSGWDKYVENRDQLLSAINILLNKGGKKYEET